MTYILASLVRDPEGTIRHGHGKARLQIICSDPKMEDYFRQRPELITGKLEMNALTLFEIGITVTDPTAGTLQVVCTPRRSGISIENLREIFE